MFDSFAAVLREALIAIRSDQAVQGPDADAAHARLAAAIEAGDAAAAAQATHDHLDPTAANLRSLIDR
jgi:DNA-binding FadR family transcriptional regulator